MYGLRCEFFLFEYTFTEPPLNVLKNIFPTLQQYLGRFFNYIWPQKLKNKERTKEKQKKKRFEMIGVWGVLIIFFFFRVSCGFLFKTILDQSNFRTDFIRLFKSIVEFVLVLLQRRLATWIWVNYSKLWRE